MLGQATLYALKRLTTNAIEHVSREAIWGAIAATLLVSAFVFALVAAYLLIQPIVGSAGAAALVGAGCAVMGVICFFMPTLIEAMKRKRHEELPPGVTALTIAKDEAKAAVDFFGPLRLVGSAFTLGLGLGRRLKHRHAQAKPY
jgi:hypothetical protein